MKQERKHGCAQSITSVMTVLAQPIPQSLAVLTSQCCVPCTANKAALKITVSRLWPYPSIQTTYLDHGRSCLVHAPTIVQTATRSLERFRPPTFAEHQLRDWIMCDSKMNGQSLLQCAALPRFVIMILVGMSWAHLPSSSVCVPLSIVSVTLPVFHRSTTRPIRMQHACCGHFPL